MKHIGLFFGSFNPIHVGHLAIANAVLDEAGLREVWFVLSPQNPFKEQKNLLLRFRGSANQRLIDVPKSREAGSVQLWDAGTGDRCRPAGGKGGTHV